MHFFALVATSFSHYSHHQANIVQKNFKRLVTCGAQKCQVVWDHIHFFFFVALRPNAGHGLLILEVSRSHTTTHHSR